VSKEVLAFAANMNKVRKTKVALETGVDVTGKVRKMLRLSNLRAANNVDALRADLSARGAAVDQGANFTALRTALKDLLTKSKELADKGYFHPKSDEMKACLGSETLRMYFASS
jgi:hypothetical protein